MSIYTISSRPLSLLTPMSTNPTFCVTDVNGVDIRCYLDPSLPATQTMSVAAGSQVGFTASPAIYHPVPLQFYMAKVSSGQTAASWDGSGQVWFKIAALRPTIISSSIDFPAVSKFTLAFSYSI